MSQFIEMFGDPMVNDKQWSDYPCLSEVTQIVLGSTPNSKEPSYWDGDIRWITPAEMTDQSYYIYDTVRHITEEGRDAANLTMLPEGAVLFSTRAPIGKVAIVGKEMCCNQGFKNFICSEKLNKVFLYYTLKYKKDHLCSLGTGTTFKELSKKTVESLKIAVPPIDLQERFEDIYNQADKSEFDGFKSQFIEMFEGDKYPHEALDSIAADWLKGQPFRKDEIEESGIHSCIHYGELFTKYGPIISQVQSYTSSEPKRLSKSGDILFPASDVTPNGLARCSMLPFDDVILGGDIIILRPKEGFNSGFLSYAINNQTSQLLTRVNGGVVKHMSSKSLKSVLIPIPPMDKQEEYIGIAHQADKSEFDGFKSQFIEMFKNEKMVPLGKFCSIEKGSTITRNEVSPGDIPVVAGGQEPSCYHNVSNREAGMITVSASGAYAGFVNYWTCPIFASDCNTISPKEKNATDTTFLFYGMKALQKHIYGLQKGGAQPHVYGKDLQNLLFPLPTIDKQSSFSIIAQQADKSENRAELRMAS